MRGTPHEVLALLDPAFKHILIDGGANVIGQFMDCGLLNEVTVTRVPQEIGGGTPFMSARHKSALIPLSTKTFGVSPGFTQTHYRVETA